MSDYVHGYSAREAIRLKDQADTLARLLHHDTVYPPGSRVLECGCGTGAQTVFLAAQSPAAEFVSIDISTDSLEKARSRLEKRQITNVTLQPGDIYDLNYKAEEFDHAFVCFVLEHLPDPTKALNSIKRILKTGGTLTVIEGDHGSWYCWPETDLARRTVNCLIKIQARLRGDALIGRRLFPLLTAAGFTNVQVTPKMVYVDASRPELVEGFSKNTFIAMVEAVAEQVFELEMMTRRDWRQGIRDLYRATESDGTFCYTFFKAVVEKNPPQPSR